MEKHSGGNAGEAKAPFQLELKGSHRPRCCWNQPQTKFDGDKLIGGSDVVQPTAGGVASGGKVPALTIGPVCRMFSQKVS
jgi:hypothetical protein